VKQRRFVTAALAGVSLIAITATAANATAAGRQEAGPSYASGHHAPAHAVVRILSPRHGDRTGSAGASWIVDFNVTYPKGTSGYTKPQLTGPGAHNNTAPLPGVFAPGQDEHLPGVVVLDSTTTGLSGKGTNLANLFNITALTDKSRSTSTIQDTWIVGAPLFGTDVDSTVLVAVVADRNHNGVYDDAPGTVKDADNDGDVDARDLRRLGVASNIAAVRFHINGDVTP
jgi:hypothetical protein